MIDVEEELAALDYDVHRKLGWIDSAAIAELLAQKDQEKIDAETV